MAITNSPGRLMGPMSAGKRPTVEEVVEFAEALTAVLDELVALDVVAVAIGEAIKRTDDNAMPGKLNLKQDIVPALRMCCRSGLKVWKISVFIIISIKLKNHQLDLPSVPEGLALGAVIPPLKGSGVVPAAVMGEGGIPSVDCAGNAGGTTGKLS